MRTTATGASCCTRMKAGYGTKRSCIINDYLAGHMYISSTEAYQLQVIDSLLDERVSTTRLKSLNLLKINVFMTAANIRQKLHQYIDKGDEKLLKLMYAVAKEYNEEDDFEYDFSEEEIKLFEERRNKRLSGESKTYSWQEAKNMITGKKKSE